MNINYWAVVVCALVAMVVGWVWYGPIFGKKWQPPLTGASLAHQKMGGKQMMPMYLLQFALTLFQVWVFARVVSGNPMDAPQNLLWIWAAVVIPTVAASSMWNNDATKIKWARFFIQGGYYFVLFVIFGMILGAWR